MESIEKTAPLPPGPPPKNFRRMGPTPPSGPRPTSGGFAWLRRKAKSLNSLGVDQAKAGEDEESGQQEKPSGPKAPSGPRPPSSRLAFLTHVPHPHIGGHHHKHDPSKPRAPSAPRPMSGGFSFLKHKPGHELKKMTPFERLQESKLHHRVVLAMFAVSLLWATSLGVARAIVEGYALPRPKMSDIGTKASQLFDRSDSEREAYALCTAVLLQDCVTAYDAAHLLQLQIVNHSQVENERQIDAFLTVRADAKQVLNDTLQELTDLVNNNGLVLNTYYINSAENTCPRVENWVQGQNSAANAKNALDSFNANTTEKVNFLSDLLSAREAYDREYIANKTVQIRAFGQAMVDQARARTIAAYDAINATLQAFRACLGPGGSCPSGPSLTDVQLGEFSALQNIANNFHGTINSTKDAVNTFLGHAATVEGLISTVITEINGLGFSGVASGFPTFSTPGAPSALDGIEANFGLINTPGLPGSVPTPFDVDTDIGKYFDDALTNLEAARLAALAKVDQFELDSDAFYTNFDFGLDPKYDPPSVFSDDQEANWNNSKDNTDVIVDENLETYASPDDTTQDEFNRRERLFFFLANSTDDLIASLPNRSLDFYAYDPSIFTSIQQNLITAGDLLIWADICWRILHTAIIINKYWTLSSIGKPPGDVRFGSSAGSKFGQKLTPDQRIARILTHPFTIAIVVFTFLGLMTWSFWYAYSPFFYEYVDGCVRNTPADIELGLDDGTMIYRNAFATAFQFAASDGDTIATNRVDELNLLRDFDCRVNLEDSKQVFENQLVDYSSLVRDFLESKQFNDEIVECLDLAQIDTDFSAGLVAKTTDPIYDDPLNPLSASAIYNCSATNTCSARCADPSRAIIQAQSHETACTLEWWLHGSILGWLMIIVTFILINWFRLEFVAAVVRIWWRRLSPGKYSFLGSCTDKGQKIYPEVMEEEGKSFEETIKDAVAEAIKKWERWGYIHAVYALFLNIPWIVALAILSQDLVYPLAGL